MIEGIIEETLNSKAKVSKFMQDIIITPFEKLNKKLLKDEQIQRKLNGHLMIYSKRTNLNFAMIFI